MTDAEYRLNLMCKQRGWNPKEVMKTFQWMLGKTFDLKTRGLIGTEVKITEKGRNEYAAMVIDCYVPDRDMVLYLLQDGFAAPDEVNSMLELMMMS